jgi:hypothetical protein
MQYIRIRKSILNCTNFKACASRSTFELLEDTAVAPEDQSNKIHEQYTTLQQARSPWQQVKNNLFGDFPPCAD